MARFFWGSVDDTKKTHWVSWSQICRPMDEGGLGIRRIKGMSEAFGMKLWWRFREQNSLWASFMEKKYCRRSGPLKAKANKPHSLTWKRMVKARSLTQDRMRWSIGDGSADFWDDIWVGEEPIRDLCVYDAVLKRTRISDFWEGNTWDETKIRTTLAPLGVSERFIQKILHIPIEQGLKDCIRWTPTPHGNFSISSAWNVIRNHNPPEKIFEQIWSPTISPSISIFAWRLIKNRIPTDSKMQGRAITMASKCRCCSRPSIETNDHLFMGGEAATKVWRFFTNWFPDEPLQEDNFEVEYRIQAWQLNQSYSKSGHVSQILPLLILWNLWTERNNVIHRNATFNENMVIGRIVAYLQWSTTAGKLKINQWSGCIHGDRIQFPHTQRQTRQRVFLVKWELPPPGWIKLNTDGSFAAQSNMAGIGGVIRNSEGDILEGFSESSNARSSLQSELEAILTGLKAAEKLSSCIWVETDAKLVTKLIGGGDRGAAGLRHLIVEIWTRLKRISYKISHIHREGNRIAD